MRGSAPYGVSQTTPAEDFVKRLYQDRFAKDGTLAYAVVAPTKEVGRELLKAIRPGMVANELGDFRPLRATQDQLILACGCTIRAYTKYDRPVVPTGAGIERFDLT